MAKLNSSKPKTPSQAEIAAQEAEQKKAQEAAARQDRFDKIMCHDDEHMEAARQFMQEFPDECITRMLAEIISLKEQVDALSGGEK